MLQLILYSETGELIRSESLQEVEKVVGEGRHHFWIDLEEPTKQELDLLRTVFQFHPLALKDVKRLVGIPKIDIYDRYDFLVLHRLFYDFKTEECVRREFEVFLADRFIVTVHDRHLSRTFATARERVCEAPRERLGGGTGFVLLTLLELAIRDYEPVMEEWQETLDEIESHVLTGAHKRILDQILQFKKLVITMRKSLIPEREVIKQLYERTNLPYLSPEVRPYFKGVIESMNALLRDLESLGEHSVSIFDVYAAMLSIKANDATNKLNFIMQRLTIAATIFLPLTFIVGIYGMNFDYLPELHWKPFYFTLWGFMISLVVGMILFFKRRKWW